MHEEITLPSGANLKITLAPFKDAKAFYQAVLEEVKTLKLDPEADVDVNLFKDLFCLGFSSKKIEVTLEKCLERVLYNNLKIGPDTFEHPQAREDYFQVLWEVARVNLFPFTKSLSARYSDILAKLNLNLKQP